jgi:SAM-dependent methyltransferase
MNSMQSELTSAGARTAQGWDTYWKGSGDVGAYASGGTSHPAILDFWNDFFEMVKGSGQLSTMMDIGTGNGALIDRALAVFGKDSIAISCIDASTAAIDNIKLRFPGVTGMVTDAAAIPLASGGYDIVTSQFGVEYAGIDAIHESARLVARGGWLGMLIHHGNSVIRQQSEANLQAVAKVQASEFIRLASAMFRSGFDAVRGADRAPYEEAARRLAPAAKELERVMEQFGQAVADGTFAQLYSDVARIHEQIQHYDPDEVLGWLERMDAELESYSVRMSSMCESAIDEGTFLLKCDELEGAGFTIDVSGPLLAANSGLPLAWAVIARRAASA